MIKSKSRNITRKKKYIKKSNITRKRKDRRQKTLKLNKVIKGGVKGKPKGNIKAQRPKSKKKKKVPKAQNRRANFKSRIEFMEQILKRTDLPERKRIKFVGNLIKSVNSSALSPERKDQRILEIAEKSKKLSKHEGENYKYEQIIRKLRQRAEKRIKSRIESMEQILKRPDLSELQRLDLVKNLIKSIKSQVLSPDNKDQLKLEIARKSKNLSRYPRETHTFETIIRNSEQRAEERVKSGLDKNITRILQSNLSENQKIELVRGLRDIVRETTYLSRPRRDALELKIAENSKKLSKTSTEINAFEKNITELKKKISNLVVTNMDYV